MRKKIITILFISFCFILCGCKKYFYDYPKVYSSYLDKSLGKWEITLIKDTTEESVEHTFKKRTWFINGENGMKLELYDTKSTFSTDIPKEKADIIFTRQLLNNMNHYYSDNLCSDIKDVSSYILDADYFYSNELNDDDKYLKKNDNSYAKKVLDNFIIKDMTPEKFYGSWGTTLEVSVELKDIDFDKNESIRKDICIFLNKKYNMHDIKVITYADKSRKHHASSYVNGQYRLLY